MAESSVKLNSFPSTKSEALAMLYLQNQDLSNLSPDQLVSKYTEVYESIRDKFSEQATERRQSNPRKTISRGVSI